MATQRPRDLWKPEHQLCQRSIRANEIEIPHLYGGEGAHNVTHQGIANLLSIARLFKSP